MGYLVRTMLVVVVAVALLAGVQVTPANAQLASEDCGFINDAGDGSYGALGTSLTLAAGEKLTISAGAPFAGAPTTITLFVNDIMVASATFPGTVEYVIPTAGLYALQWHIDLGGPATWTVSCAAAAVDPAAMIAALVDKTLVYLDKPALGPGLKAKLTGVSAAVLARKPKVACAAMSVYIAAVKLTPTSALTAGEKTDLINDANKIRAAIGC